MGLNVEVVVRKEGYLKWKSNAPSVTTSAAAVAAATSITVNATTVAYPVGAQFNFGGVIATLTAAAAVGATTLTVSALSGAIASGTSAGPAAKTVGFALGGIKASISRYRQEILNNNGSFSHVKTTRDPEVSISVSKLYQDVISDLLSDSVNGFNAACANQSTPTGTLSFESIKADGTLDIIQFPGSWLISNARNQADNGDTHEYQFKAVGEPVYTATATLT